MLNHLILYLSTLRRVKLMHIMLNLPGFAYLIAPVFMKLNHHTLKSLS